MSSQAIPLHACPLLICWIKSSAPHDLASIFIRWSTAYHSLSLYRLLPSWDKFECQHTVTVHSLFKRPYQKKKKSRGRLYCSWACTSVLPLHLPARRAFHAHIFVSAECMPSMAPPLRSPAPSDHRFRWVEFLLGGHDDYRLKDLATPSDNSSQIRWSQKVCTLVFLLVLVLL